MQLLLCSATGFEIRPTIDYLEREKVTNIEVLITGIGMTAATYAITKKISESKPDFIIQAGVAGSLDPALSLSTVFVVQHETIGDLGVEENDRFIHVMDMKLQDANSFPWKNGKLSNNSTRLNQCGLRLVNGVTVNEISTQTTRIHYYRDQLQSQVETMEGAALHYVALQENIPFLQVRSLSNYVGERDKSKWQLDSAITQLNLELERILSKLIQP